jgi:hyaluronan synthase
MPFNTVHHERLSSMAVLSIHYGRRVSICQQGLNLLGCAVAVAGYYFLVMHTKYPITFDIFVTIILAELTRWCNGRRRDDFYSQQSDSRGKEDFEKGSPEVSSVPDLNCVAAVVGWREDPELFTRALRSYQDTQKCTFLLVGIDGDDIEDHDMVKVFNKVSRILPF